MNNLEKFFEKFNKLEEVIDNLDGSAIPWMIAGSGCLFLLGNEREPDDVDIFIPAEFHDKVDELFGIKSFSYNSETEEVRNSNPYGSHSYQITSNLHFKLGDKIVDFVIDDEVLKNRKEIQYNNRTICTLPPEDVLLIKAILQRGAEVGKHDIDDINNFIKIYPEINYDYLKSRIQKLDIEDRVKNIFKL